MIISKEDIKNLTQEQRDTLLAVCLDILSDELYDIINEISSLDRITSGNWMHKVSFVKARIQNRKETIEKISEVADIDMENFSEPDAIDDLMELFNMCYDE